jgi:5-methylcytosine-specific restriction endonuclease McrA
MRRGVLGADDVCIVCGHGGADSVDHVIPKSVAPELAEDPGNLAPCHHEPCPVCGQRCNNVKGTKDLADVVVVNASRDWFTDPLTMDT